MKNEIIFLYLASKKNTIFFFFKVQAPYTASWKSEEALSEINNYNNKLRNIKEEVTNYDLEENIEHYHDKCIEMEMNLLNLKDIWQVVTNWESFEQESNEKKVGDLVVQEVMVSLNSIKEEISRFCKRSFDSRIEIHMTLQTKLSILEGNFSLIEDFRSKAIKSRHWEIISKVCGFDAIRDGEEVIDVLTLEDFINLGLEKQGSEIKSIIGKFIDFNMISYQLFKIDELDIVMDQLHYKFLFFL